jgi:hypothetical protein
MVEQRRHGRRVFGGKGLFSFWKFSRESMTMRVKFPGLTKSRSTR